MCNLAMFRLVDALSAVFWRSKNDGDDDDLATMRRSLVALKRCLVVVMLLPICSVRMTVDGNMYDDRGLWSDATLIYLIIKLL